MQNTENLFIAMRAEKQITKEARKEYRKAQKRIIEDRSEQVRRDLLAEFGRAAPGGYNAMCEIDRRYREAIRNAPAPKESDFSEDLQVIHRKIQELVEARKKYDETLQARSMTANCQVEPVLDKIENLKLCLNKLLLRLDERLNSNSEVSLEDLDEVKDAMLKCEVAGVCSDELECFKHKFKRSLNRLLRKLPVTTASNEICISICPAESVWDLKKKLAREMNRQGSRWDADKIKLTLLSETDSKLLLSGSISLFDCGLWHVAKGVGGQLVAAQVSLEFDEHLAECKRKYASVVHEALKVQEECSRLGVDLRLVTQPASSSEAEAKFARELVRQAVLHEELSPSKGAELDVRLYLGEIDGVEAQRHILCNVPADGSAAGLYRERFGALGSDACALQDRVNQTGPFLDHVNREAEYAIENAEALQQYEVSHNHAGEPTCVLKYRAVAPPSSPKSPGKGYHFGIERTPLRLPLPCRSKASLNSPMSMSTATPEDSPGSASSAKVLSPSGDTPRSFYATPLHLMENRVLPCIACKKTIYGMPCDEPQQDGSRRGPLHFGCVEGFAENTPNWEICHRQVCWPSAGVFH